MLVVRIGVAVAESAAIYDSTRDLEGGNLGFEFWGFDFFMELGIGLGIWEE